MKYGLNASLSLKILLLACLAASGGCQPNGGNPSPGLTAPKGRTTRPSLPDNQAPIAQTPAANQPAGTGEGPKPLPVPSSGLVPVAPPASVAPPSSDSSGGGSSRRRVNTDLYGLVTLPGRILSDNGGSILSNNGSNVLSNNGASIIANNAGRLVSNNGAAYRLLGTEPQRPLTNAFIYLSDRDERFYLDASGRAFTTTVDANGRYAFKAGYPTGKDVIVNAIANDNLRLVGFVVPDGGGSTLDISLGSTLATEHLRGVALRRGQSMGAFSVSRVRELADATQAAIVNQAIVSVRSVTDRLGQTLDLGVFDLRADHTGDLRNQYVVAISAVDVGNTVIKAISDGWKALLGERPAAVTSVIGNGKEPAVSQRPFETWGFAEGDHRNGNRTPALQVPLGFNYGVAVGPAGDIFVACFTRQGGSGHIRWIKPDGTITTLWLPNYYLYTPTSVTVEKAPTGNPLDPGSVLVADSNQNAVIRVPLIDNPDPNVDLVAPPAACGDPTFTVQRLSMEVVAGEAAPLEMFGGDFDYACVNFIWQVHPWTITPAVRGADPVNLAVPAMSRWRLSDEGPRTYQNTSTPIPSAARYAHLDGPTDVAVDEYGSIYIADKNNQRIRFIPSAQAIAARANWYNYQVPTLAPATQEIQALSGSPASMQAGCIYTIAGNPTWDTNKTLTPQGATGWIGAFGGDGAAAQLAKLDQPYALAINPKDKCLYVAELDNNRVRKIDRDSGIITTVAGSGDTVQNNGQGDIDLQPGYGGDGGPATAARFGRPKGLAFDADGTMYIGDSYHGMIRMVTASGTISTVAGRYRAPGAPGADQDGDGDALTYVDIYGLEKIAVDPNGNVLFNEMRHGRLRKLWRQWE